MRETMHKRFKILAVDDDPVNIQVMTSALIDEYDIITALSGHDAISQVKMHMQGCGWGCKIVCVNAEIR